MGGGPAGPVNDAIVSDQDIKAAVASHLEVLEFTPASDLVQQLEARGDFKFKGIFGLFNNIHQWTDKFQGNSILPTTESLTKDVKLPEDKLREYLTELMGRGSSNAKLVFAMPAVDYAPGSGLRKMVVYCRPGKKDGTSVSRFVSSYVEKNHAALVKWLQSRKPRSGGPFRDLLADQIANGHLNRSMAGNEISSLFYSDLEKTNPERRIAYQIYAKPVIERLLKSGQLLLLQGGLAGHTVRAIYFNNKTEMEERFRVLASIFLKEVMGQSVENMSEALDPANIKDSIASIDRSKFESLSHGHRQAVMEVSLLAPRMESIIKETEEAKKQESLESIMENLVKAASVVNLDQMRDVNADTKSTLLSVTSVLNANFPIRGKLYDFVLHKNVLPDAIKHARDLFDKVGDPVEVQILAAMNVDQHLDKDQLKAFMDLEQRVLFTQLPFLIRFWRSLFGSGKLAPAEMAKIKQKVIKEQMDAKVKIQTEEARQAQKKLVSERLAKKKKEESSAAGSSGGGGESSGGSRAVAPPSPEEAAETAAEEAEKQANVDETLAQMTCILDSAWAAGEFPNRTSLLQNFPEMDENTLIHFLKRHAVKEILSFRVRYEKPEYQWPILISKNYLRKNGRAMLSKAKKDADTQRNATMPNQEKFEVATAIEDFLTRILAKKGA